MEHNPFYLEKVSVRLVKEAPLIAKESLRDPQDAVRVLAEEFKDYDREVLGVVNLKADNTPINMSICSMGVLNQAVAHPRELLKSSYLSNANAILLFHNHPSGNLEPSRADIMLTSQIQNVCELAGIPLIDHIIIGHGGECYSFKQKGILPVDTIRINDDINQLHFAAEEKKGKDKIMEISVSTNKVANPENGIKGIATISFGDAFKVRKVAIMENRNGEHFVSMPSYRTKTVDKDGNPVYKDICNPITKEFRESLYNAILDSFKSGKDVVVSQKEGDLAFSVKAIALDDNGQPTKGLARLCLEDSFVINNMSIVEGKDGSLFVAMPSYKTKSVDENGKAVYKDVCYPTTKEFRQQIQDAVLENYRESNELKKDEGEIETPFEGAQETKKDKKAVEKPSAEKTSIKKKLAEGETKKQTAKAEPKPETVKKKKEAEIA